MKRYGIILLLMGLFLTLSASALAADVKFNGEFIAGGMYLDKTTLKDGTASDGPSTAFYFQRLRVRTDFIVSPGLTLVTRFDALERAWGAPRATGVANKSPDTGSAGTTNENENIAFDWAYIHYDSPVGTFRVGYMNDGAWGTVFMDNSTPTGLIAWSHVMGQWYFIVKIVKVTESSYTAKNTGATTTDLDSDKYAAAFKYRWKGGETGILAGIGHDSTKRKPPDEYKKLTYNLQPYAIAQIGPVKVQAELNYFWGKVKEYEVIVGSDQTLSALAGWVDAVADVGMFYAGGTFAYVAGDDPDTTDKLEGYSIAVNGGRDWDPCLILFNNDRTYWAGAINGYAYDAVPTYTSNAGPMSNVWFLQGRVGARPITPVDIMASVSYAVADKKPAGVINSTYGWEIDIVGTYKITNNLSYMVGAGYLFTGDYFKGNQMNVDVSDNFLLINKLTLTF